MEIPAFSYLCSFLPTQIEATIPIRCWKFFRYYCVQSFKPPTAAGSDGFMQASSQELALKMDLRRECPHLRSCERSAVSCLNGRQNEYQGHFRGEKRSLRRFAGIRRWFSLAGLRIYRGTPSIPICESTPASADGGSTRSTKVSTASIVHTTGNSKRIPCSNERCSAPQRRCSGRRKDKKALQLVISERGSRVRAREPICLIGV